MKLHPLDYVNLLFIPITGAICAIGLLTNHSPAALVGGLATISNISPIVGKLIEDEENEKLDKLKQLYESGELQEYEEMLSSLSEEELSEWIDSL